MITTYAPRRARAMAHAKIDVDRRVGHAGVMRHARNKEIVAQITRRGVGYQGRVKDIVATNPEKSAGVIASV